MPTILITGGCGFIGRHLVAAVLARGERVRILDTAAADDLPRDVTFIRGSILDADALAEAMTGVQCVYHLAGIAKLWTRRRADFELVNARGTEMVLCAAAAQRVDRMLHCSTEAILLPPGRGRSTVIDEDSLPAFADMPGPYTRSKHLAEQAVLAAVRGGLDVVIVNPTVPVGPGDHNLTPPAAMLAMFLDGSSPAFLECVLNLVDVRDVAAGMVLAAERGRTGDRYILGGENVAMRELLARIERLCGRPMPKRAIPALLAMAAAAVSEWMADHVTGRTPAATREGVRLALRSAPLSSDKARRDLGYTCRSIEDGLSSAIHWLIDRRAALK